MEKTKDFSESNEQIEKTKLLNEANDHIMEKTRHFSESNGRIMEKTRHFSESNGRITEKTRHFSESNGQIPQHKWIGDFSSKAETDSNKNLKIQNIVNGPKYLETPLVPPDGGWGWMIILGGFITMVLGSLPLFGFSIIFSPLLMSFSVSSLQIAWIMNIHGLIWNVAALFVGPLGEEFGWRKVAITSGVLNFLSVILSAFAPDPKFLFFSYSILGGIGGSTGLSLCFIIVSRYFLRRRGFALAVISLGICVSAFASPILCNYLLDNYGYMGASLIIGALVLNQCVAGALFQPVEWHMKPADPDPECEKKLNEELLNSLPEPDDLKYHEKRFKPALQFDRQISLQGSRRLSTFSLHSTVSLGHSIMDLSSIQSNQSTVKSKHENESVCKPEDKNILHLLKRIIISTFENMKTLKYMRVKIICLGSSCLVLGYINFQMWIPFVITNAGYSLEMAAWCTSAASIANTFGRISMTFVSDWQKFNIRYGYTFSMLILAVSIIVFSLVQDIKFYAISVCVWGLGIGIAYSLNATVFIEVMGVEKFPAVFGISSLFIGIFSVVLGPVVGLIRDATSSYTYALWLLGGAEFLGFTLWLLMPLAVKYDQKKYAKKYLEGV